MCLNVDTEGRTGTMNGHLQYGHSWKKVALLSETNNGYALKSLFRTFRDEKFNHKPS